MTDEVKPVDAFAMGSGVPLMEGEIRPKPKYADRVHKRVLLVGAALIVLMIGIFFLALDGMDQKKGKTEAENNSEKKFTETTAPKDLTEPPDSDGLGGGVGGASLVGSVTKAQVDLSGGVAGGAKTLLCLPITVWAPDLRGQMPHRCNRLLQRPRSRQRTWPNRQGSNEWLKRVAMA